MPEYSRLIYRGNYQVTCEVDFSETLLSARYPGGYREDIIIGSSNGLRAWALRYSALHTRAFVQPVDAEPMSREQYVWDFYVESKSQGNVPFVMECPRDGKDYLCVFKEDKLSLTLIDHFMRTTGLLIEQVFVKGVTFLEDGSLGDPEDI